LVVLPVTDRKALTKALAVLKAGDTLIVTRLDRLARSARDHAQHARHHCQDRRRLQVAGGLLVVVM
jgi:DNA invertase Pin-like site-specific DNA recombinase